MTLSGVVLVMVETTLAEIAFDRDSTRSTGDARSGCEVDDVHIGSGTG